MSDRQQSNNVSDEGSVSDELIFINQYSDDHNRARDAPNRRIIGSYVQRNIHRTKRIQAHLRLSPKKRSDVQSREGNPTNHFVAEPAPQSSSRDQIEATGQSCAPVQSLAISQAQVSPYHRDSPILQDIEQQDKLVGGEGLTTEDVSSSYVLMESFQAENNRPYQQTNSPRTLLDMGVIGTLNQFEAFRTSSPESTQACFHYFLETLVPKVFPVSSTAKEHRNWIFHAVIANPELLYAISALSASSLAARRQSDVEHFNSMRKGGSDFGVSTFDEVWFKSQAVRLLKSRIAGPSPVQYETVLYTVMCLLLAAFQSGEQHEMRVHTTGLGKLISLRGGCGGLPVHSVAVIVSSLYISSTIIGIPPILAPPIVEADDVRVTFPAIFEAYPSLRGIGRGFTDNEFTSCLSISLTKACQEMGDYVILRECFQRNQWTPTTSQKTYYHLKCCNCHFLATRSPFIEETVKSDRQEPFRLALLIFWNGNTQLYGPKSMLYRNLTTQLKSALERTDLETFRKEYFPVLMWILLLGAFASRDQAECSWFIANIAERMCPARKKDWESMRAALGRLFYLENIYAEDFEKCWKEAGALAATSMSSE